MGSVSLGSGGPILLVLNPYLTLVNRAALFYHSLSSAHISSLWLQSYSRLGRGGGGGGGRCTNDANPAGGRNGKKKKKKA